MTKEQLEIYKERVYNPFNETYQILREIRDKEPKDDAFWKDYYEKIKAFPSKYGDSEISKSLQRVLLDAGDEVGRIERKK